MYFFIALSTLSSILYTFLFLRQWDNPDYETLKYIIGWYGLKAYTKVNMYVKKIYKIKNYFYDRTDSSVDIHFISNGQEVLKISKSDSDLCKINTYDFIFYELDKEDEPKFMVIRDQISKELALNIEEIEKSNVRFLAPQIIIDKSNKLIDFTQNIYLINNKIFSRPFITWYMDAFHNYFLDNKQEYSIRFFDNKMDFIEMNSEQCVILGKDTYEIVKYERERACETDAEACETNEEACETDEEACETDEETESKQEFNTTLHITQERGC